MNNARYADDTVLLSESEEKMQNLLTQVVEASERIGLSMNCKSTEFMVVSKKNEVPKCKSKLDIST